MAYRLYKFMGWNTDPINILTDTLYSLAVEAHKIEQFEGIDLSLDLEDNSIYKVTIQKIEDLSDEDIDSFNTWKSVK